MCSLPFMHLNELTFLRSKLGNQLLILLLEIVYLLLAHFANPLLVIDCLLKHCPDRLLFRKLLWEKKDFLLHMQHLVFDTVWNIWIVFKSIFLVKNGLLWCEILVLSEDWKGTVVLGLVIDIRGGGGSQQIQILLVFIHFTRFWWFSDDVWAFNLTFAFTAVFTIKNLVKIRV